MNTENLVRKDWYGNSGFSVVDTVTLKSVAEVQMDRFADVDVDVWIVFELLGEEQHGEEIQYFSTGDAAYKGIVEHLKAL